MKWAPNFAVSLYDRWRWRDFAAMGIGIAGRYGRCGAWWRPHLELTRVFIRERVGSGGRIAVLGAGRLLDIDLAHLLDHYSEIHLFDRDPTARRHWLVAVGESTTKRTKGRIVCRGDDVTGSLSAWSGLLARHGASCLKDLTATTPTWCTESWDAVVSLNLLGQIPLYWRDRVLASKVGEKKDVISALERSMATLQSAHLAAIQQASPEVALLISDTHYHYYTSDSCEWSTDPALFGDAEIEWNRLQIDGPLETWWWHVAPQFVERDDYGEIHRVEAKVVRPSRALCR